MERDHTLGKHGIPHTHRPVQDGVGHDLRLEGEGAAQQEREEGSLVDQPVPTS